jgi:hypothetical protein
MAETKPITTRDKDAPVIDNRPLRTVEQTINEPLPEPTPTQAELDAIMLGEYEEGAPPPEGETAEAKKKREEDARKKREAKAAADQQASYQTRNA